jgi:IPT/TIG domain
MVDGQIPPNSPPDAGKRAKKGFWKRLWDSLSKDNVEGDAHVSVGAIILTGLYLLIFTSAMLYNLVVRWPACELPEETLNANVAEASSNTNAASLANGNAATAGVNTNAAANTNTNANTAANTNLNTNAARATTNTNLNNNANVGTTTTTTTPAQAQGGETGQASTTTTIDANSVEPKSGPVTGKTLVTIKGKNFGTSDEDLKVKFDGVEAKISKVSDESISARTPEHTEGAVDVSVERGDQKDVLPAEFIYTCPTPTGTNLFWMLIFAGALGGCIHALRSLFWYVGQRELRWSWLPMYYTLPFIGSAMAMLFGLLIFAGLFDNSAERNESLFIIAVAGLVGMFSQQAALKLTDVANAIFSKPGQGKEAEPQKSESVGARPGEQSDEAKLTATEMDKERGSVDGGDEVTIKGTGFSESTTVSFGGKAARVKKETLTPTSITVVTPRHKADKVEVELKSGTLTAMLPTKFEYLVTGSPDLDSDVPLGE